MQSSALEIDELIRPLPRGPLNTLLPDSDDAIPPIPRYLSKYYWCFYEHPRAVWVFERRWLVNLILWGKYLAMRDAALSEMGPSLPGRTLQVACVYGDLTTRMAARVPPGSRLDVVDVLPAQLDNLQRKLPESAPVQLLRMNSAMLRIPDALYDRVLLFFLLHEMPREVREATLREALRVAKPGSKLVVIDFGKPAFWHPLKYIWHPVLRVLEPFAPDLWKHPVETWLPESHRDRVVSRTTYFGGFYQKVVIEV
jgi:ubiquinone/menaquinone biosynthesis C-methylase UbiE